jgi:hypothetical protein
MSAFLKMALKVGGTLAMGAATAATGAYVKHKIDAEFDETPAEIEEREYRKWAGKFRAEMERDRQKATQSC